MKVEIQRSVKFGGRRYAPGERLELSRAQFEALPQGTALELEWYSDALREDGPTFEEYVAAGYTPETYPPRGYTEKPSPGLDAFRAQAARVDERAGRVRVGHALPPEPTPRA